MARTRKTARKVQGRYKALDASRADKLFRYGRKDLEHLTFGAFEEFLLNEYRSAGPGALAGRLKRFPRLAEAHQRNPDLGRWLFFLLELYDPDLQCNLRPHLIPGLEIASRKLEGQGKRRAGGRDARAKVLGLIQRLRRMMNEDREIMGAILADWMKGGRSGWDAATANSNPVILNEDRAREHEVLLARRDRGRALPKQINDIDGYVFAMIEDGVAAVLPGVERKTVLNEIARATGWSAARPHRGRSPQSIEKKIHRAGGAIK
jgi:hypothetical protein